MSISCECPELINYQHVYAQTTAVSPRQLSEEREMRTPIPALDENFALELNRNWQHFDDHTRFSDLSRILLRRVDIYSLPAISAIEDLRTWEGIIEELSRSRRAALNRAFYILSLYGNHNRFNPDSGDIDSFGGWRQTEKGIFVAYGLHPWTRDFFYDATALKAHS